MKNEYVINTDGTVTLLMNNELKTIISVEDLLKAQEFTGKWYAKWSEASNRYYVVGNEQLEYKERRTVYLHVYLLEIDKSDKDVVGDHKDGNTFNNTRDNLRIVTKGQNNQNAKVRKDSTTGVRGVKLSPNGTYLVRVCCNGKRKYIGTYKTLEEANEVATAARRVYQPFSII